MSTLKADTIVASDGTSPVTLTKQEATKQWISYDGVNNASEGSLNVSSVTDLATGEYNIVFTNAFSSAHDRCTVATAFNTVNDGSTANSGPARAGTNANIGTFNDSNITALVTGSVQVGTAYGSSGSGDGGVSDNSKVWVMAIGDLA
mgnify:CR=1 FL=1